MVKSLLRKKNRIKHRKSGSLIKDKRFILITSSISLGIVLVSTNVIVTRKTYEIIALKRELDNLATEKKDLNEEVEAIVSPVAIKERALKLEMEEIDSIDELMDISY